MIYYDNRNIVVVVVVIFLVCVDTPSPVNQVSLVNVPMKLWKLIEKAGGPTEAKELLLKRCQLHKNEHQQVFAIDDGLSIAMLCAVCYALNLCVHYNIEMDTGYRIPAKLRIQVFMEHTIYNGYIQYSLINVRTTFSSSY